LSVFDVWVRAEQLEVLLAQPEIDYGYIGLGHMFPRSDGIFLGGTFDPNDR
jgi:hypothetical protein